MRMTAKGQVTIPQDVRERARMMPGTDVEFRVDGADVRLISRRVRRGQKLVDSLRGRGDFRMTTDEVVALMRGSAADQE